MNTHIIRTILLNTVLRVYLHRSICLCSFFALLPVPLSGFDRDLIRQFGIILGIILAHHIASAFQFIRTKINLYVDLVLLLVEISVLGFSTLDYTRSYVDRWSSQVEIGYVSLNWSLLGFLALLAAPRIATIVKNKGQLRMGMSFDILINSKIDNCDGIQQRQAPSAPNILIGRSIWRKVIAGESKTLTRLRGTFAVVLALAVAGFSMVHIILEPVRETALTPVKELRVLDLPWDFENEPPSWNVVVFRVVAPGSSNVRSDSRVDSAMALNSVQMLASLTNGTSLAVDRTIATPVIPPGVNLMGTVKTELRQVYKESAAPAFGLFGSSHMFVIGRMLNVLPDPEASFLPNGRNISTFRVFPQVDLSELRIVLDGLESSVLKGFSAVGGLWTFLSGIFTIISGASARRSCGLYTPLSVFGLAHTFQTEKIRRECVKQYPKLLEEDQVPQEERGLLKLVRDHIIELYPLDEEDMKFESRPSPQYERNDAQLESGAAAGEAETA
ncbi:unnamed protein product [Cyclocybe aegerita]|uniref:Uncharacterized protein n=1 Tax=Cyclocybe aegerita TaxID=1973307 RepID=A0A8S0W385_CYCAE|nr:unnamed protein product [Cyclocybe aegerita]